MPTSTRTDVVAIPVLTGSLLRLPLGLWRDRVGTRGVPVGFFCFSSYRCSWVGGLGRESAPSISSARRGAWLARRSVAARQPTVSAAAAASGH